jgi:uncharacterized DUF497 family protein
MRFERDEDKRRANIGKHRIDFVRAQEVFDGRAIFEYPSSFSAEARHVTVAQSIGRLVAVIWTWREGDVIRIISARSARDGEKRKYRELHG